MSVLALATITPPADDDADDVPPPFGLPRTPPPARVRRRPGASGASTPGTPPTASPEPSSGIPEDISNPRTARLREAWELKAKGLTHDEIAARLGISEPTSRRWVKEASQRGVAKLKATTADDFASELLIDLERQRATLLRAIERAERDGDDDRLVKLLGRMDQHIANRSQALYRMGVFVDVGSRGMSATSNEAELIEEMAGFDEERRQRAFLAFLKLTGDQALKMSDGDFSTAHQDYGVLLEPPKHSEPGEPVW